MALFVAGVVRFEAAEIYREMRMALWRRSDDPLFKRFVPMDTSKEGGETMTYSIVGLKDKVLEMYPELERKGIAVNLTFDADKDAYILTMHKDQHQLTTHLERQDADDCMKGIKCVSLGIQVEQFSKNFTVREGL
jgi:hypothetical protein